MPLVQVSRFYYAARLSHSFCDGVIDRFGNANAKAEKNATSAPALGDLSRLALLPIIPSVLVGGPVP